MTIPFRWLGFTVSGRANAFVPARCYTFSMSEGRSRTLLWVLIGGGAFFLFVLAVFTLVYLAVHAGTGEATLGGFGDRIGVVDLDGVILSPQPVVDELKKFGDDSSIKAIILHVNSPGGGVAASEEIYRSETPSQREEKEDCGFDRDGRGERRLLCGRRVRQDLCRRGQHSRIDRRDRA